MIRFGIDECYNTGMNHRPQSTTASQTEILSAVPADAAGIYRVQRETWLVTYPNDEYHVTHEAIERKFPVNDEGKIQAKAESIANLNSNTLQWVAKDSDEVVGWVVAKRENHQGKILALYVLPLYQGKKVGAKLIQTAIEWIGENNRISVEVAKYNSKAIDFYSHWGFEPTGDIADDPNVPPPEIVIPHIGMIRLTSL